MSNDTTCSNEQVTMWIEIYNNPGLPEKENEIKARARAFDNLYQCYRKKLYTYLLLMGCKKDLANQIFNGVWEKIIHDMTNLAEQVKNGTLDFSVHIFTIARTELLNHIKKLNKFGTVINHTDLPQDAILFALKISRLPRQERDTFLLKRMGLSLEEIAQVQQNSINDVRKLLESAINLLRPSPL